MTPQNKTENEIILGLLCALEPDVIKLIATTYGSKKGESAAQAVRDAETFFRSQGRGDCVDLFEGSVTVNEDVKKFDFALPHGSSALEQDASCFRQISCFMKIEYHFSKTISGL